MTQISIKTKSPGRNENCKAIVDALLEEGYQVTGPYYIRGGIMFITNAPRNFVERIDFTRSAVTIRG
jgi:hypothetical protein